MLCKLKRRCMVEKGQYTLAPENNHGNPGWVGLPSGNELTTKNEYLVLSTQLEMGETRPERIRDCPKSLVWSPKLSNLEAMNLTSKTDALLCHGFEYLCDCAYLLFPSPHSRGNNKLEESRPPGLQFVTLPILWRKSPISIL